MIQNFTEIFSKQFDFSIENIYFNEQRYYFLVQSKQDMLFYYCPNTNLIEELPILQEGIKNIFFSKSNPKQFCVEFANNKMCTYITSISHYTEDISYRMVLESSKFEDYHQRQGNPAITYVPKDIQCLSFSNGFVTGLSKDGKLTGLYLNSHSFKLDEFEEKNQRAQKSQNSLNDNENEMFVKKFFQNLELCDF